MNNIEDTQVATSNHKLLLKASDLYYESKIDESMDILNQIQTIEILDNSDQALYKRYLLLNLMAQGNLQQARTLRDKILDEYYEIFSIKKKDDNQRKVDIQDILLFICILSNHERFLFNVFQRETTEQLLYDLQLTLKQQNSNLSLLENILCQLSASLYYSIEDFDEQKLNHDNLIESISGRLLEDCLYYVLSSFMRYNPFRKEFVSEVFEKCAHKLYQINPQHPLICYSLAIYYYNNNYDIAFDYFQQALEHYNKNPVCNSIFLKFLTQYQKQQEFEYYYPQISSINLNNYRVALAHAEFLATNYQQQDAIEVILNSLRLASDKTIIQYDYNYFHIEVQKFLSQDQLRYLYESAIKYGYDNYSFYEKLQNIYMEIDEHEKLLEISFQYIKQQQQREKNVEQQIYYKMESVYELQNNLKSYVELQLSKEEDFYREFKFFNFTFDYQVIEQLFQNYSRELIEVIIKIVEYEREDLDISEGQIDQKQLQKLLFITYFKYQIEINNLLLRQITFKRQLKDIALFQQQYLLLDFYF